MLSLPHARIWLILGWLLIVGIFAGSLMSQGPSLGIHVKDKIQHFGSYFILMSWFAGLYPRKHHWVLACIFIAMGGLIEILQGTLTTTREMDIRDFAANTAGVVSALLLARLGLANWARRVESWWTGRTLETE